MCLGVYTAYRLIDKNRSVCEISVSQWRHLASVLAYPGTLSRTNSPLDRKLTLCLLARHINSEIFVWKIRTYDSIKISYMKMPNFRKIAQCHLLGP